MDNLSFLNGLNTKQQEICQSPSNYILTACPGSGKTRTITYRLAYLQQKYPSSRKYNIAITYTNRAAEEIENRLDDLGIDTSCIWTGTIHQFCMHFIIRPYAMYSDRLRKGYRIIDEYITAEYGHSIANQLGINCGYDDPLSFPKIRERYDQLLIEKQEIDFDLILSLSYDLVKANSFICENIASIIRSIHVDEYQDTKELQYQILAEIVKANTAINLLFVGDVNQAIYGTLGSVAKSADEIRMLYPLDFCEETLSGCYRSTQRLVDYVWSITTLSLKLIPQTPLPYRTSEIPMAQYRIRNQLTYQILLNQLQISFPYRYSKVFQKMKSALQLHSGI